MKQFVIDQPEFLFCEVAKKDYSLEDERKWVYHIQSSSLIEFLYQDDFPDFPLSEKTKLFQHEDDHWIAVFIQDNCDKNGFESAEILQKASMYLVDYLEWEKEEEN